MLDQLQLILKALPWTGPAVAGGFVLGLLTMVLFPKRRSRTDRVGFALLTWCLVVAAVVTLSPVKDSYFGVPTLGCDWSIWKPLDYHYWFDSGSRPPNVWLFFPAGVGVMLLDGVWRTILGIAFLFALPPGIETLQDLYPELKRSCSSQDVMDNWTGLVLGLALGLVLAILVAIVRAITRAARRRRERRDGVLNPTTQTRATADDAEPLPLGGRADERHYDDFRDFDDRPNSSRWYEHESESDVPPTATSPIEGPRPADERHPTVSALRQVNPEAAHDDSDRTQSLRTQSADTDDSTQIMPKGERP